MICRFSTFDFLKKDPSGKILHVKITAKEDPLEMLKIYYKTRFIESYIFSSFDQNTSFLAQRQYYTYVRFSRILYK